MPKWSDALSVLRNVAPMIATAAGGPLAGTAVAALEKVFGVDKIAGSLDKRQDSLAAIIGGATPEQLLSIKTAEQNYQVRMAELGFKDTESLAALAASDRDSARKREVSLRDLTPRILAYIVVTLALGGEGYMLFGGHPKVVSEVLFGRVLGTLDSALMLVLSYYFGASHAAAEKKA